MNKKAQTLIAAQNGDQHAFSQIVKSHQAGLRAFIASRINTPHAVDDIAQETFVLALKKLQQVQNPDYLNTWLFGIALNLVRNHNRKIDPLKQTGKGTNEENDLERIITDELEKQITISTEENLLNQLKLCVNALNQDIQLLLKQFYVEQMPLKALTELYQIKHSTLTMRLSRTRQLLRDCISNKQAKDSA